MMLGLISRNFDYKLPELMTYDDRLKRLNVFLTEAKSKGGLIEVFKILHRFENINPDSLFQKDPNTITRSNGMQLKGNQCNTLVRRRYFNNRNIDHWNRLLPSIVSAQSINSFKSSLD